MQEASRTPTDSLVYAPPFAQYASRNVTRHDWTIPVWGNMLKNLSCWQGGQNSGDAFDVLSRCRYTSWWIRVCDEWHWCIPSKMRRSCSHFDVTHINTARCTHRHLVWYHWQYQRYWEFPKWISNLGWAIFAWDGSNPHIDRDFVSSTNSPQHWYDRTCITGIQSRIEQVSIGAWNAALHRGIYSHGEPPFFPRLFMTHL